MRIPQYIVDEHKKGVEHLKFYGVPVAELDKDELLAMVNLCAVELTALRKRLITPPPIILEDTRSGVKTQT